VVGDPGEAQQLLGLLAGHGLGEVVALAEVTAEAVELDRLLVGLDALGHHGELEGLAKADHGVAEGGVLGGLGDPSTNDLSSLSTSNGKRRR
jgi:hypothetical protein